MQQKKSAEPQKIIEKEAGKVPKDYATLENIKPVISTFNLFMMFFFFLVLIGSLLFRAFGGLSLRLFFTLSTTSIVMILWFVINTIIDYVRLPPQQLQKRIREIEEKAEKQPEKVRYAWDLARTKMEAYFDRNLI